jgi:hypothetical protein
MSTISVNATTERRGTLRGRLSVYPWLTVLAMAVVLAYGDGFWMTSLRGAVGSVERTQGPFATWLRESTLVLPVFIFAVLGALTLGTRLFGPVLRRPKTVVATAMLIVAAGTMVGIAEIAASSAYDYHLQSSQLELMESMRSTDSTGSMGSMDSMGSMGSTEQQQQATLGLQVRAVGYGSGLLLVTNLVLVGWVLAIRGGRLDVVRMTRQRA